MKAAVVEKPGVLTLMDIPEPEITDPYQARCRLLYGSTCSGTDQHLIAGRFPWPVDYPIILGHESVGLVEEIGESVRYVKPGDLVVRAGCPPIAGLNVFGGGFTEVGIIADWRAMQEDGLPRERWQGSVTNLVLPPGIRPDVATMIVTWRETLSFSRRLGVGEGSRVLVIGTGGVGLSFAMQARNLGAAAIAMVGSASRAELAYDLGADIVADYRQDDVATGIVARCPEGLDFIIDAIGKAGQVDRVLQLLKPGGCVANYGVDEYNTYTIAPMRAKGPFTFAQPGYAEPETHEEVVTRVLDGSLRAEPFLNLDDPFPLSDIHAAFDALRDRRVVKALVKLT